MASNEMTLEDVLKYIDTFLEKDRHRFPGR
jgi:hypothetical protein